MTYGVRQGIDWQRRIQWYLREAQLPAFLYLRSDKAKLWAETVSADSVSAQEGENTLNTRPRF